MSEIPATKYGQIARDLPARYLYVGLLVLTWALYGRCLGFEFVNLDDTTYILDNSLLKRADLEALTRLFVPGSIAKETLYVPLTYLSYWLEVRMFGFSSTASHGFNVVLHSANACLMMAVCLRLTNNRLASLAATVLFIMHPLQVECVAWAFGRKDVLATAFALTALWSWLKGGAGIATTWPWLVGTVAFSLLAMLAKPSVLILPGLILLISLFLHGRKGLTPSTWWTVSITMLIAIGLFLANRSVEQLPADAPPLLTRLGLWPYSLCAWLPRLALLQPPLSFYPWPKDGLTLKIALGVGVISAILLLIPLAVYKGWPTLWFSITFVAIGFAPTANIAFGYREFITGDRYGYFPLIGLYILAGTGLAVLARSHIRSALLIASLVGIALCGTNVLRTSEWRNSTTLWSAQKKKLPDNPYAHVALGKAIDYRREKAVGPNSFELLMDAQRSYLRGIELGTTDPEAFFNLANNYYYIGKHSEAIAAYRQALRLSPGYVEGMVNKGRAHMALEQHDEAIKVYRHAANFDSPHIFIIHMNLALAYEKSGRISEALTAIERALQAKQGDPDALQRRAHLLNELTLRNQTAPRTP